MTVGVTLNYDIEEYLQIISKVHKIRRLVFSWILDVVTPIPSQFSPVLKLLYRVNYKWAMVYIFLIFFNLIFGSKASNTQCGGDFSFGQGLFFFLIFIQHFKCEYFLWNEQILDWFFIRLIMRILYINIFRKGWKIFWKSAPKPADLSGKKYRSKWLFSNLEFRQKS